MRIGTVFSLPLDESKYATSKDEYDNRRTVIASELPESAEEGDEYAYHVDFFTGGGVTLKNSEPEE